MKNFFSSISGKSKALYLLWFSINFLLYLNSENFLKSRLPYYADNFYPFQTEITGFEKTITFSWHLAAVHYDYREFTFYTLFPIVIYAFIKMWKNDK